MKGAMALHWEHQGAVASRIARPSALDAKGRGCYEKGILRGRFGIGFGYLLGRIGGLLILPWF